MTKIERFQSRLDALAKGGVEWAPPEKALRACRTLQEQLRKLKREVLKELMTVRREVQEQARRSLSGPRPSLRELWERRDEGTRQVLGDLRRRVTGQLDQEDAAEFEAWAGIKEEIDVRLERLETQERRLNLGRGRDAGIGSLTERRTDAGPDVEDDELYAAVGAAVQEGLDSGGFCHQCGQAVTKDDRFCSRCGLRLLLG